MSAMRKRFVKDTRTDEEFRCDAVKRTADPTGTLDLRKRFYSVMQMRFRRVRSVLQTAVVTQDVLGLKASTTSPLAMAGSTGNRELGFQTWVDTLLEKAVVENGAWMRTFMASAYNRAVARGQRLTGSTTVPHDAKETIDSLTTLCLVELQGIVEAASQRIMRAAVQGWLHNEKPAKAFTEMDAAINKVGMVRSKAMIALMVVKAFTTGTLDQFESVGIKQVGLIPETIPPRVRKDGLIQDAPRRGTGPGSRISRTEGPSRSTVYRIRRAQKEVEALEEVEVVTAGDEDVCPECEDIEEGNPYTIDQARSIIPAHPECRCAFVPL